jgi:hypothetical protein
MMRAEFGGRCSSTRMPRSPPFLVNSILEVYTPTRGAGSSTSGLLSADLSSSESSGVVAGVLVEDTVAASDSDVDPAEESSSCSACTEPRVGIADSVSGVAGPDPLVFWRLGVGTAKVGEDASSAESGCLRFRDVQGASCSCDSGSWSPLKVRVDRPGARDFRTGGARSAGTRSAWSTSHCASAATI